MTTKTKLITKAEVQAELRKIKRENPNAINPSLDGGCLYHAGRGRNITRCIIGQMGYNMGLPTPKADAGGIADVAEWDGPWVGLFTHAAVEYMNTVQQQADGDFGEDPIAWGKVKL